jgi:hypothetical protein
MNGNFILIQTSRFAGEPLGLGADLGFLPCTVSLSVELIRLNPAKSDPSKLSQIKVN